MDFTLEELRDILEEMGLKNVPESHLEPFAKGFCYKNFTHSVISVIYWTFSRFKAFDEAWKACSEAQENCRWSYWGFSTPNHQPSYSNNFTNFCSCFNSDKQQTANSSSN